MSAKPTSKTFGKSTREVPASSEKAKKWYPADDDAENKKVSLLVMIAMHLQAVALCFGVRGQDSGTEELRERVWSMAIRLPSQERTLNDKRLRNSMPYIERTDLQCLRQISIDDSTLFTYSNCLQQCFA
jgi:hypothetical protein